MKKIGVSGVKVTNCNVVTVYVAGLASTCYF